MTVSRVRTAIFEELRSCGHVVSESEHGLDLISLGVNSLVLIQILSALEDEFGIDIEIERLFSEPVTVARLEAEITRTGSEGTQTAVTTTITPKELKEMLDREDPIDLIDVREPAEWGIVNIPGARLVPKGEWLNGSALTSLRPNLKPVFYCRTGVRTVEVVAVARQAGFPDAVHLEGGVVAWVGQIDPTLPVY